MCYTLCTSKPTIPEYKEPVTVEAPPPQKAPETLYSEDTKDPEKKKLLSKKRGTKALRTDIGEEAPNLNGSYPALGGSGLFIPRT